MFHTQTNRNLNFKNHQRSQRKECKIFKALQHIHLVTQSFPVTAEKSYKSYWIVLRELYVRLSLMNDLLIKIFFFSNSFFYFTLLIKVKNQWLSSLHRSKPYKYQVQHFKSRWTGLFSTCRK
jgi:hypothetical protein